MSGAGANTTMPKGDSVVGAVVIGRNEGDRLKRCLESVRHQVNHVVYVDSGSSDGSVEHAESADVHVVSLDESLPFSAARSRNEGVQRLLTEHPEVNLVQVVDGDCELRDGWVAEALQVMESEDRVAVVCGRRRERDAESNVYQRLIDMEWNTPVGEAKACGGDALIRIAAFKEVGGYNPSVLAGEEPELCYRLRHAGWTIQRIDHEMTWHDANLTRFAQWWIRAKRNGYAYGLGWSLHGGSHERYRVREVRSILEWALFIPAAALGLLWWTWGLSVFLFGLHGLLWWRVRGHRIERGDPAGDAELYARFVVLGKFAELLGLAKFAWHRLTGQQGQIFEYKHSAEEPPSKPVAEAAGS